jgi:ATP-dependent Clp protease adaptor protein ClpS
MKPAIYTDFEEDVDVLENEDITKKIVIYNDDVNSFDFVIHCLMKYCKHTMEQAEQCALFIHSKGRYSVKEGDYDTLKPIKEALTEKGIDAKIEE